LYICIVEYPSEWAYGPNPVTDIFTYHVSGPGKAMGPVCVCVCVCVSVFRDSNLNCMTFDLGICHPSP